MTAAFRKKALLGLHASGFLRIVLTFLVFYRVLRDTHKTWSTPEIDISFLFNITTVVRIATLVSWRKIILLRPVPFFEVIKRESRRMDDIP